MSKKMLAFILGLVVIMAGASIQADWVPGDGHKMHFPQLPDEQGWDVDATQPIVLADDWMCSETGPVEDIHFWGSWRDMDGDRIGDVGQITAFVLSIHADIPASQNPDGYSKPGETLWELDVESWTAVPIDPPTMEHWLDASHDPDEVVYNDHDAYFQYNIDLTQITGIELFEQVEGTIYWLNISAVLENNLNHRWGWKSSIDHWNDDAVWAYWGELGWIDIIEPPRYNEFNATINADGTWGGGSGTNAYGDGWYYYVPVEVGDNPWWNIWFYDNPFNYENNKVAQIHGFVWPVVGGEPSQIIIAVNWSTDVWSLEGTSGQPPLPGVNQALMIGRQIIWQFNGIIEGGEMPFTEIWEFLDYNPEWISIDIWGFNFGLSGAITHECVTTSLDLAFVITGGGLPTGACCWPSGACTIETQADCEDAAGIDGTYMGNGSQCAGDGDGNGVDDLCEGVVDMGACCYGDPHQPTCVNTTATICGQTYSGTWYAGEDCATFICPVPQGACCHGDPVQCSNTGKVDCENNLLGTWYDGEDCATFTCPVEEVLKWESPPDLDFGDDVNCTYQPQLTSLPPYLLAADFPCEVTGPITDIYVYGSWYLDNLPNGDPHNVRFVLSIHEDIPADPGGGIPYSMPGDLICLIDDPPFAAIPFAEDLHEGWLEPPDYWTPYPEGDAICWLYMFDVANYDCIQMGTAENPKVYWLDVQAYPEDVEAWFGWKTSMPPWNDDAVWAFDVDDGHPISWGELIFPPNHQTYPTQSADLAFAIYGTEGQPLTGACCYEDGSCTDGMTAADCASSGGDYGGDGTNCANADTDQNGVDDFCDDIVTLGACCYGDPAAPICVNTTQTICEAAGGQYAGTWYAGQDCATFICPITVGACCYDDGSCTNGITAPACTGSGGDYAGNGTVCAGDGDGNGVDDICEGVVDMGACCYGDPAAPTCVNTTATVCGQTYNGTWYTGQDCATFTCPTVGSGLGACCLPDGSCVRLTQVDCDGQGGDYAGSGTHCLGDGDANGIDDACEDREDRKWLQWPDLEPTGIDVFAMDYVVLADDYECTETGPLTKIEIWGSWLDDVLPDGGPGMVDFVISLHEDIPAGVVTPWSQPGEPICLYHFGAMDFEVAEVHIPDLVEGFWNPAEGMYFFPGDHQCFKYTFTLPDRECFQWGSDEESRIYWIDVQAYALAGPTPVFFGWKTSKDHWNDDAVWAVGVEPPTDPWEEMRYPIGHPYATESVDLAFSVYGTCCVLRVGDANGFGGDEPTIGDCSVMIDALFISGDMSVIACIPEADVNQSGGISPGPDDITIGDISVLIDYLFITGSSLGLPNCM